jgi:hypothetical protein
VAEEKTKKVEKDLIEESRTLLEVQKNCEFLEAELGKAKMGSEKAYVIAELKYEQLKAELGKLKEELAEKEDKQVFSGSSRNSNADMICFQGCAG